MRLISTTGAADRVLPGPHDELPICFAGDGASIYVVEGLGFPHVVSRLAIATGTRTPWTTIAAPDPDLTSDDDARFVCDADGDVFYSARSRCNRSCS